MDPRTENHGKGPTNGDSALELVLIKYFSLKMSYYLTISKDSKASKLLILVVLNITKKEKWFDLYLELENIWHRKRLATIP